MSAETVLLILTFSLLVSEPISSFKIIPQVSENCQAPGCHSQSFRRDGLEEPPTASGLSLVSAILSKLAKEAAQEELAQSNYLPQEEFCGQSMAKSSRIVGGKAASLGQFPWQAQIWTKKYSDQPPDFTCGGTLVSEDVIVTAGHCLPYTSPDR